MSFVAFEHLDIVFCKARNGVNIPDPFVWSIASQLSSCMWKHAWQVLVLSHKGSVQVELSIGWLLLRLPGKVVLSKSSAGQKQE